MSAAMTPVALAADVGERTFIMVLSSCSLLRITSAFIGRDDARYLLIAGPVRR